MAEKDTDNRNKIIMLNSNINISSSKSTIEKILEINFEDDEKESKEVDFKRKPIKLILNSYGGSIYDGLGIVSVIEQSKTPIHTYVYGYAMSMGFIIGAIGHKRFASKHATFMYHQMSSGVDGSLEDIKQSMEQKYKMEIIIDEILLSKTKIRRSELDDVKKLKQDWFLSSDEALKLGVFDELI